MKYFIAIFFCIFMDEKPFFAFLHFKTHTFFHNNHGSRRLRTARLLTARTPTHLHQRQTYHNPYQFTDSRYQPYIDTKCPTQRQGTHRYGKTSLTGTQLHGREEKQVAKQRGESHYQHTVKEVDVACQYAQNKIYLQRSKHPCNKLKKERSIEWLKEHPLQYLQKTPGRLVYMYYNDMDNIPAFSLHKDQEGNRFITLPYRKLLNEIGSLSYLQYIGLFNLLFYVFLLLLAVKGCYILIKKHDYQKAFIPMMIIVGGSISLVLAVHGETRFKAPFMPFIFMMAAFSISTFKLNKKA